MALDKDALKGRILSEFEALGATMGGHSWMPKFAEALANAVVDEIQANGKAIVKGGSSAGAHNIE
ncbi:hypothetical protein [Enterovibrio norvegicus]|uniref:hypothetical protein n=1 Tax=Enterovibrio norvegicus TaxID=188144 RepID=UPI000C838D74|nr:hypothetical protein [Enterovibrio norvegicus]PMN73156.1 hypothetical protein BCT27_12490 [Enterovibrio norvegicus]